MPEEFVDSSVSPEIAEPSSNIQLSLIRNAVVKQNSGYNPEDQRSKRYTVDFDGAMWLLNSPNAKKEVSPIRFGEDRIKEEGEKSFKRVVKAFVDHGDIQPSLAYQIGRVVRPSDILIHDESFARFLFMDDKFPESAEKRADLEIGTEYINGWAFEAMKKATDDVGLALTDAQVFQLVLKNGISHEYGHAIERVIILLRQHAISEGDDAWKEKMNLKDSIEQSVYDNIAPRGELQELLVGQPMEGYAVERKGTTSERFAVGFENLGTRYGLEELNVDQEVIEKVMGGLEQIDQSKLNDAKAMMKLLSDHGLNIQDFASARLDIYSYLKDQGKEELYEPLRWGPDTRSLGYFFPLTRDELQKFISSWS